MICICLWKESDDPYPRFQKEKGSTEKNREKVKTMKLIKLLLSLHSLKVFFIAALVLLFIAMNNRSSPDVSAEKLGRGSVNATLAR